MEEIRITIAGAVLDRLISRELICSGNVWQPVLLQEFRRCKIQIRKLGLDDLDTGTCYCCYSGLNYISDRIIMPPPYTMPGSHSSLAKRPPFPITYLLF